MGTVRTADGISRGLGRIVMLSLKDSVAETDSIQPQAPFMVGVLMRREGGTGLVEG
jgi:hypothetical protein